VITQRKGETSVANALSVRLLLVSNDDQTIKLLLQLMEQSEIHVEVISTAESAIHELCRKKYDAVVIDCQNQDSLGFLRRQRATTSNRTAVVWSIVNNNDEMSEAFRAGANFVLVRPLTQSILGRTLRVSYPLMVREKRRYHRARMEAQIFLRNSSHSEFIASAINLSEGGIALEGGVPLQIGERLDLRFKLPGAESAISVSGEVCWFDHEGRVGFHFFNLSEPIKQQIQHWIAERLDELLTRGIKGN
jgi:CheY-like chemotaxis protein